jgi:N-acetylgalactosamine kinase
MTDTRVADLPAEDQPRARHLLAEFQRTTGRVATCVVRAPGRVNLLGEHTDYNGLPVLPMAIDRSVLIAGAPRERDPAAGRDIRLFNVAPQFAPRRYELTDPILPYADGDWGNYSKAAAQGLLRHCGAALCQGADFLVDGNIPSGAGLSSSSALVVANALALLTVNDIDVPYETLAELLPEAERYVGTLSGGMDQATSLLARVGHALRIDFFPLRVRTVPLPAGYTIVVCHSLLQAEKAGAARNAYNLRVIECRLACRVLERALGGTVPRGLHTLGDLVAFFPHRAPLDFLSYLTVQLPNRPLHLSEIAAAIGADPARLRAECAIGPELGDHFNLLRRTRHVLSEAERVNRAEEALRAGDAETFGHLMDTSHASCRDDYEISCPALEELIQVAKEAGALGARLTGAGFGGCTVNLVRDDLVAAFLTRVERAFYRSRLGSAARSGAARLSEYCFVFRPQAGARVIRL